MRDQTYNGWKNYPTWCVSLWLNNDAGTQEMLGEIVGRSLEDADGCEQVTSGVWTQEQADRIRVADDLRAFVTDEDCGIIPDLGGTMAADLLGYALDLVDWDEIAASEIDAHIVATDDPGH